MRRIQKPKYPCHVQLNGKRFRNLKIYPFFFIKAIYDPSFVSSDFEPVKIVLPRND